MDGRAGLGRGDGGHSIDEPGLGAGRAGKSLEFRAGSDVIVEAGASRSLAGTVVMLACGSSVPSEYDSLRLPSPSSGRRRLKQEMVYVCYGYRYRFDKRIKIRLCGKADTRHYVLHVDFGLW